MPSIYEIAESVGVSPATVSRALNPSLRHKVKASTLDKILSYCDQHDYYGKLAARSLATGQTYCIGLVLGDVEADISSPFFAEQIHGIIDVLTDHGYRLKIIPVASASEDQVDHEVRRTLFSNEVDGFILNSTMLGQETLEALQRVNFPVVIQGTSLMAQPELSFPHFGIDNVPGYEELCRYLVSQHLDHVAVLGKDSSDPRLLILRRLASQFHLTLHGYLFPELSNNLGRQPLEMYLKVREHLSSLQAIPAWVCLTDLWAMGAMQAWREASQDRHVFICGYDNIEDIQGYRTLAGPVLNTIAPPRRQLGMAVANQLFHFTETSQTTLFQSKFILRNP